VKLTDDDVQKILKLLDESPYDELHLETDGFKLTLRPSDSSRSVGKPVVDEQASHSDRPAQDDPGASRKSASPRPSGPTRDIYPPMPGTFYRAPSPGAKPFVDVGQVVDEDTIVGLVETMKLMNSVMAGCRGEVQEICVENAALIDAQDVLMRIRVSAGD